MEGLLLRRGMHPVRYRSLIQGAIVVLLVVGCGSFVGNRADPAMSVAEMMARPSRVHFIFEFKSLADGMPGKGVIDRDGNPVVDAAGRPLIVSDAVVRGSFGNARLAGSWRLPDHKENDEFPDGVPVSADDASVDWQTYSVTFTTSEVVAGDAPKSFDLQVGTDGSVPPEQAIAEYNSMADVVAFVRTPSGPEAEAWTVAYDRRLVMVVDSEENLNFVWASPDHAGAWAKEAPNLRALRALLRG